MEKISAADQERQELVKDKNATTFWNIPKHRKIDARISELDEILKEQLPKKVNLLKALQCADDSGIPKAKQNIAGLEEQLKKYAEVEKMYADKKDEVSRLLNDSGEEWAVKEKIKRQKQQANEQQINNKRSMRI